MQTVDPFNFRNHRKVPHRTNAATAPAEHRRFNTSRSNAPVQSFHPPARRMASSLRAASSYFAFQTLSRSGGGETVSSGVK